MMRILSTMRNIKRSSRLDTGITSRVAAAALFVFISGPALADHETGHDEVAKGGIKALEE